MNTVTYAPKMRDLRNTNSLRASPLRFPGDFFLSCFKQQSHCMSNIVPCILLSFISASYDFLTGETSRVLEKDLHTKCLFHRCVASQDIK